MLLDRTFTDPFHCAHLRTILHSMQSEINFRQGLLLFDCPDSIVDVLCLIEWLLIVLHRGDDLKTVTRVRNTRYRRLETRVRKGSKTLRGGG